MKKTTMPDWCVAVKKAMIDHDEGNGLFSLAYQPSRQWCAGAVRERPGRNRKVPEHQRGGVPELTYISSIPERTA